MAWEEHFYGGAQGGYMSILGFEVGVAGQGRGRKSVPGGRNNRGTEHGVLEERSEFQPGCGGGFLFVERSGAKRTSHTNNINQMSPGGSRELWTGAG